MTEQELQHLRTVILNLLQAYDRRGYGVTLEIDALRAAFRDIL